MRNEERKKQLKIKLQKKELIHQGRATESICFDIKLLFDAQKF